MRVCPTCWLRYIERYEWLLFCSLLLEVRKEKEKRGEWNGKEEWYSEREREREREEKEDGGRESFVLLLVLVPVPVPTRALTFSLLVLLYSHFFPHTICIFDSETSHTEREELFTFYLHARTHARTSALCLEISTE